MHDFLAQLFNTKQFPFFLIAGPCVVESEALLHTCCGSLKQLSEKYKVPLIFKSSYRKANRTSTTSFTGIGDKEALKLLYEVGKEYNVPVLTDIHSAAEASVAAEFVDVLQIPAFLSRQTDILEAAAETGKIVNIKKGQFLNAGSMQKAAEKVITAGNKKVMLTERGNSFGYGDLVVDFRNLPLMKNFGYPVIMDCTHAVQQPNQSSGITGGTPEFVPLMAKCAIVVGADGLFIETHPTPSEALSDGANMLPLNEMDRLLKTLVALAQVR